MKEVVIKFLIITLTAYQSSCSDYSQPDKQTLNQVYDELQADSSQSVLIQELLKFTAIHSLDCIKEELKLTNVGTKTLPSIEAQFLSAKAIATCSNQTGTDLLRSILNKFSKNNQIQMTVEDMLCTKKTLQKLDPVSKFVENFNENLMTDVEKEACDERVRIDRSALTEELRRIGIDGFSAFTCGRLNSDEIYKYMCTFGLVVDEVDAVLKSLEMDKLVEELVKKIEAVFDCRMSKLLN